MQKIKEIARQVWAFLMQNPKLVRRLVLILAGLLGYSAGQLDAIDKFLIILGGGCQ